MTDTTPEDWPQITDVSMLYAEDFKIRNTRFLQDPGHPHETGRGEPPEELREEIWRVPNSDITTAE